MRTARLRAFAKINLDLRVLARRADGFHELRTVFHTISRADDLEVSFTPGHCSRVTIESDTAIADNLLARAAQALDLRGDVRLRLRKRIPMGAGLGGGS